MELYLVKEEDLIGLTKPWPLKDAKPIWETLSNMKVKDFNILVVGYLSSTNIKHKRGRDSNIEKLAKTILFDMSAKQREATYKLIKRRTESIVDRGWWKEDIKELIQQKTNVDINHKTHRNTGFTHILLDKKKFIYNDYIVRIKLQELSSIIDSTYKEWLITYVETEDNINRVTEYKFNNKNEAIKYYNQLS